MFDDPGFEPWLRGWLTGAITVPVLFLVLYYFTSDARLAGGVVSAGILSGAGLLVYARGGR